MLLLKWKLSCLQGLKCASLLLFERVMTCIWWLYDSFILMRSFSSEGSLCALMDFEACTTYFGGQRSTRDTTGRLIFHLQDLEGKHWKQPEDSLLNNEGASQNHAFPTSLQAVPKSFCREKILAVLQNLSIHIPPHCLEASVSNSLLCDSFGSLGQPPSKLYNSNSFLVHYTLTCSERIRATDFGPTALPTALVGRGRRPGRAVAGAVGSGGPCGGGSGGGSLGAGARATSCAGTGARAFCAGARDTSGAGARATSAGASFLGGSNSKTLERRVPLAVWIVPHLLLFPFGRNTCVEPSAKYVSFHSFLPHSASFSSNPVSSLIKVSLIPTHICKTKRLWLVNIKAQPERIEPRLFALRFTNHLWILVPVMSQMKL